jgi:hypothetical protein
MQQEQALDIARMLVKAGMPMFIAHPDPTTRTGWRLPFGWETNEPDVSVVDAWRPGMLLCAVTGHTFDLVDVDPRSGGSEADLGAAMPHSYLTAETPSGGRHHFVKTLGVPSLDGKVAAGIDVKSGTMAGEGRGFAFIAPTVRASKVDGVPREYRWVVGPKGPVLPSPDQLAQDGSGGLLRARVLEIRRTAASETPRRVSMSQARREWDAAVSGLTDSVRRWQRIGWGGEAHSSILAVTTRLARLSPETAEQGFLDAFEAAGAVPDADDLAKLHSAIEKAVPDVVVSDSELSPAELFFSGGGATPSPGTSLPAVLDGASPAGLAGWAGTASAVPAGEVARRFATLDEFEAEAIPTPDYTVEGLVLSRSITRLSAASNVGKTWLALDLAAHIANGMAWQGRDVAQGRVLFVAAEGAPSFGPRMRAWREYHQRNTGVRLLPDAVQIAHGEWDDFCASIAGDEYRHVIFDTQGAITSGLKENDNDHGNMMILRLNQLIRVTGAGPILLHHTGWEDKTRARGSTAANNGMDTELMLTTDNAGTLTLTNSKQRYIERAKQIKLKLIRYGGGLVVEPSNRRQNDGMSFFDSALGAETEARVMQIVEIIKEYYATGGTSKATVRALTPTLRKELNVKAKNDVLRAAILRYAKSVGVPVQDDVMEDE